MKILEIKVLRGPNYWSVRRPKLIQMKIDLEEMEQRPTNSIEGFRLRLEALLPTLYEHRCSEGVPGGFFSRIDEGTWMGHVIEHVALEIQTLDYFFRNMVKIYPGVAEEQQGKAQDFLKLRELLKLKLREVKVYRTGSIQIDAFIIGQLHDGSYGGLRTKLIET